MPLTQLQRRILALLEEAQEENVVALTNTVAVPKSEVADLDAMSSALIGLLNAGLICLTTTRDASSRAWLPLRTEDALQLLRNLTNYMDWHTETKNWKWRAEFPRAIVLSTTTGLALARRILSNEGWPENPLESYR